LERKSNNPDDMQRAIGIYYKAHSEQEPENSLVQKIAGIRLKLWYDARPIANLFRICT